MRSWIPTWIPRPEDMLSWLVSAVVGERHGRSMKKVHGSDVFTHSSSLLPAARQPLGVHVVCASYMAVGCVGNVAGSEIQGAWIRRWGPSNNLSLHGGRRAMCLACCVELVDMMVNRVSPWSRS